MEDPHHPEANLYKALTHIALTVENWRTKWLFWRFGIRCSYDIYDWRFEFPENIPSHAPTGRTIQMLIDWFLIPRIETSLDYLNEVEADSQFTTYITSLMIGDETEGTDIEIDLTDVYALEGGLNLLKMALCWLNAYNFDCNFNDFEAENFHIEEYLSSHPEIGISEDANQMALANAFLQAAIPFFDKAVGAYEQERDDQMNDVFFLEEEDLLRIKKGITELNSALMGPQNVSIGYPEQTEIRVDLTAFFGSPIEDLQDYMPQFDEQDDIIYGTFPDPTLNGLFPDFDQEDLWDLIYGSVSAYEILAEPEDPGHR